MALFLPDAEPMNDALWTKYYYVQGMETYHDYLFITGNPPEPTRKAIVFALLAGLILLFAVGLLDFLLRRMIRRRMEDGPRSSLVQGLVVVMLVALFFTTWETALKSYVKSNPYQVFIPDPVTMWKENPFFRGVQERLGQRYPSAPVSSRYVGLPEEQKKGEGVFRILCLGDSQVKAVVDRKDDLARTYPKCLERALRKAFPRIPLDVINGGVSGYTSYQGLSLVKKVAAELRPDLVILGYGYHDANFFLSPDHEVLTDSPVLFRIRKILYGSEIFIIARKLLMGRQGAMVDPNLERTLYRRVPPELFYRNYEEFLELGRRFNFKVAVLFEPLKASSRAVHENTELYRREGRRFAEKRGVPLIDAYGALEMFKGADNERLFTDDIHLSGRGHEEVAKALFLTLVNNHIPAPLK